MTTFGTLPSSLTVFTLSTVAARVSSWQLLHLTLTGGPFCVQEETLAPLNEQRRI